MSASMPQRLYLIQVAILPGLDVPIVCYLIQTSDGTNILIDSGLAPNTPPPPGLEPPLMGKNVVEQLADIGLQPADIQLFICTHFDPDHAGNHDLFPDAEFIVQRAHYDAALNSPRFAFTRPHWNHPDLKYRFVDGDTNLLPGVDLLATNGHTTGHQSVLVHLPETGAVLLAIDAVTEQSRFIPTIQPSRMDEDAEALQVSARKLLHIAEQEKVTLVVFGHDPVQWKTVKKLPDFYG